ncbi:hypothetical protein, partial [Microcystis aeruginosa]|uniref:hypothetical protein n=1 Tax=Microcystis aeruginosa TaxID=1126 RepID=UPI001D1416E3
CKKKERKMLKKKPTEKSFKWEEQVQAISTVILTTIAIISIVFSLGKDQEKLENLETQIKDINVSLKTFCTREDAEKDFAIHDRLWEARYDALEKEQPKKCY